MTRSLSRFVIASQLLVLGVLALAAHAASYGATGEVTCPASGQSAQVIGPSNRTTGWAIINESGVDVRIGYVQSGTFGLTAGNSILLRTGKALSDSAPGLYTGRVVCSSTTATAVAVGVIRNTQ